MQVILETPRLLLRRMTLEDAPLLLELNSKPEVLRYIHEPMLVDEDHARQVITDIILPQYTLYNRGRWAVHLKADGRFAGWCGLKWHPAEGITDLGYRLLPVFWGKGYASEAALHTLNYGFDTLAIDKITGRAHAENLASVAILQKIGMRYAGNEVVDNCLVKIFVANKEGLHGSEPVQD